MISAVSSSIATGAIVVVSNTVQKKAPVTGRFLIGTGVYMLLLALLSEADANVANMFALLVLFLALYNYGPPLFSKLGVTR